jgi:inorganic pyrophosphatase/exopolyphosphatase
MSDQIHVIGHVNPDTDSIAAAIGYAWLLRERDGTNTVAARAGALNPQTAWVLKTLSLEAPILLDVVRGTSRLILSSSAPPVLSDLPYPPLPDGTRDAQGVVSRKKQLLPVVLGLLER